MQVIMTKYICEIDLITKWITQEKSIFVYFFPHTKVILSESFTKFLIENVQQYYKHYDIRKVGWVVESACLEYMCTGNCTQGSNPWPSDDIKNHSNEAAAFLFYSEILLIMIDHRSLFTF